MMTETHDIFLRAHTVVLAPPKRGKRKPRRARHKSKSSSKRWPDYAVVFDCESRIDSGQALTFGFFRVLRLEGDTYLLEEEGAFFDDNLPAKECEIMERYIRAADTEVKSFPPHFPLYPRSQFVKKVFYKYARKGALIVGFNICFDLARLARKWPEGKKNEWSLVLVEYPDGNENINFPRILIEPIDSKKSFISFRGEWIPEDGKTKPTEIGDSRFLDLRTLLWALFNLPLSLKSACKLNAFKKYKLPKKIEHKPTGKVTVIHVEARCLMSLKNGTNRGTIDFVHSSRLVDYSSPRNALSRIEDIRAESFRTFPLQGLQAIHVTL
jgi:hypothetical protein